MLLKRVLPGLAAALLAVGCAQGSSHEISRQDAPTTQASPTTQATSTSGQADAEEESASVSSDVFGGHVTWTSLTDTVDVKFDPVFSLNRRFGCWRCIPPVASGGGDHIGGYVLELRDASGMAIRSVPFNVRISEGDGVLEDGTRFGATFDGFEVVVSDPPVYESFAVTRDGVELGSVSRSRNAPSISVSGPSSGAVFNDDETISVSWVGSDADGDELVYRVYYSTNGGSFYRIMFRMTEAASKSFSATWLRGSSRARIGVSVSDGTRSVFAETPIFSVAGHAPEAWSG